MLRLKIRACNNFRGVVTGVPAGPSGIGIWNCISQILNAIRKVEETTNKLEVVLR